MLQGSSWKMIQFIYKIYIAITGFLCENSYKLFKRIAVRLTDSETLILPKWQEIPTFCPLKIFSKSTWLKTQRDIYTLLHLKQITNKELYSILCNSLNGKRIWKIDTHIHITERKKKPQSRRKPGQIFKYNFELMF